MLQSLYWYVWVAHVYLALCEPGDPPELCRDPETLLIVMGACLSIVAVPVFWAWRKFRKAQLERRRWRKWEQDRDAARAKQEADDREHRALTLVRERENAAAQQQRERRWQAERRATERLPQLERIFLFEWGNFKAAKDPYDEKDINALRNEFCGGFLNRYPMDAPLLRASNDVLVRAIVGVRSNSWPELNRENL